MNATWINQMGGKVMRFKHENGHTSIIKAFQWFVSELSIIMYAIVWVAMGLSLQFIQRRCSCKNHMPLFCVRFTVETWPDEQTLVGNDLNRARLCALSITYIRLQQGSLATKSRLKHRLISLHVGLYRHFAMSYICCCQEGEWFFCWCSSKTSIFCIVAQCL